MTDVIAARIEKELGISNLVEMLAEKLSGSDLNSLLLAVLKLKINKTIAPYLLDSNPVSTACDLNARLINRLESIAYETTDEFEAVDLSPLVPLGAVSVLTGLNQANVLSTIRAYECASDPTIGLSIECARRRKEKIKRQSTTHLCTSHRVVRYPLPQTPGFTAHFKLFSLVSSGRDTGSFSFETQSLKKHIESYLSFITRLEAMNFAFNDIEVELSDTRVVSFLCNAFNIDMNEIKANVRANDSKSAKEVLDKHQNLWTEYLTKPAQELAQYNLPKHLTKQLEMLEKNVCDVLKTKNRNVKFHFNLHRLTGLGYYKAGPCFHIKAKNNRKQEFTVADGGMVNWTQELLCDRKERLMTSAIGLELLCRMFEKSND